MVMHKVCGGFCLLEHAPCLMLVLPGGQVDSVEGDAVVNNRKNKIIVGYELHVKASWQGQLPGALLLSCRCLHLGIQPGVDMLPAFFFASQAQQNALRCFAVSNHRDEQTGFIKGLAAISMTALTNNTMHTAHLSSIMSLSCHCMFLLGLKGHQPLLAFNIQRWRSV